MVAQPVERSINQVEVRRFTVEEFQRLISLGVLPEDERVELVEGTIVAMSPINVPHVLAVNQLTRLLGAQVGDRAILSIQNPVRLGQFTMPQPDVALWRRQPDGYRGRLPDPDDLLLVIEVADSSTEYDRGGKAALYAAAGVEEYWVVNLPAQVVEVYRQPREGSYRAIMRLTAGDNAVVGAFPDVVIPVEAVLSGQV